MQKPPTPTVDENFSNLKAQAERAQLDALQTEATSDTATLMARYGNKLALGMVSPAPTSTSTPTLNGTL